MIEIWNPKWKTREVLIACHKVSKGQNLIRFTKCNALKGIYEASGADIMRCPIVNNGKLDCYAVPLAMLNVYQRNTSPSQNTDTQTAEQVLQPAT